MQSNGTLIRKAGGPAQFRIYGSNEKGFAISDTEYMVVMGRGVITSIGDLKCKPGYKAAFWDKEYLTFSLIQAPQWLKLNPQTGEVSGTPGIKDAGEFEVVVQVTNSQGDLAKRKFFMEVVDKQVLLR